MSPRLSLLVATLCVAAGCSAPPAGDVLGVSAACYSTSDCAVSGSCLVASCIAGRCESKNAPFGLVCAAGGASRCNGSGACVEPSPVDVLSHHNDNARTGLQSAETILHPGNVDAIHFGLAFTIPVDDDVYAQPLYVQNVSVAGPIHDVLYVATMGDSVYAFDADTGLPLWHETLLERDSTPLRSPFMLPYQAACTTISGNIGALATPAIDVASGPHGTLYEVLETVDGAGAPHFYLHALDLSTGAERPGSPVAIENIAVDGEGVGGDGMGHVRFDPRFLFSRLSVLVVNGSVYVGFSSICDQGPFHGWLLAYDEQTLALTSVFNATPDTSAGGIWQGGDGPAADDAGNVYVVTGNGPFNADVGGRDYGDSMLRLSSTLDVMDYFTPHDAPLLWQDDLDLGSAGVLLVPGTTLLAHISKTDTLRLVDGAQMGGYDATDDSQIVQELDLGPTPTPTAPTQQHQGQSNPVAWTVGGSPMVYFQTWHDPLRQYELVSGQLKLVAVNDGASTQYYPGAGLSVSANGSAAGTGIVWALMGWKLQPGTLMAFDATNVSHTLWTSAATDGWLYAVHTKPTIANGRVYVPTASHEIVVYAGR